MHSPSQSFCSCPVSSSASSRLVCHPSSSVSLSSSLHNAPPSSASLRSCLCSRPVESSGSGSLADQQRVRTIVRGCRGSDDEAGDGDWVSSVAQQAGSFLASVGGLAPLESVTHAGVRGSHPSLMAQVSNDTDEAPQLPEGLDTSALPKHVAIIMDGNSRWAEQRGLPTSMGHEAGVRSLREVVKLANSLGVKVLTVFAFSKENWLRPKTEVDFLMLVFENAIKKDMSFLAKDNIRVHYMGDLTLLPDSVRDTLSALEEHTKHHTGLKFCVALSYSGRYDIASACQRLAAKVEAGELSSSDITESAIEDELKTSWLGDARDPDLLIRTSGEQRLSNFLLWQSAYTELYFVHSLWPDFGALQFGNALLAFQNRNRRFGKH